MVGPSSIMRTLSLCSSIWCARFLDAWRVMVDIAVWGVWGDKWKDGVSEDGPAWFGPGVMVDITVCGARKEKADGAVGGWWSGKLAVLPPDSRSSSSTSESTVTVVKLFVVNKVFLKKFMVLCVQNLSLPACLYWWKTRKHRHHGVFCPSFSFFFSFRFRPVKCRWCHRRCGIGDKNQTHYCAAMSRIFFSLFFGLQAARLAAVKMSAICHWW